MTKIDSSSPPPETQRRKIEGRRFGRLRVAGFVGRRRTPGGQLKYLWRLICDCENETVVEASNLLTGHTTSCGCKQREAAARVGRASMIHGLSQHRVYKIYEMMKDRCNNPRNIGYSRYGGRGIKVCSRWNESFETFVEDMGLPPSKRHQLDRIDNDGSYAPNNCRWVTPKRQAQNRANTVRITYNDETLSLSEWAERLGIQSGTLHYRLTAGWSVEKALTTPVR